MEIILQTIITFIFTLIGMQVEIPTSELEVVASTTIEAIAEFPISIEFDIPTTTEVQ